MFDRRLLACVALFFIASAAVAQNPAATLTLTDTARTASASGGPFFVPNQTYTAALPLGLANMGNSASFICDALANPCYVVQLNVTLPADYAQQHPTDRIRVTLGWDPQASDLDMHIYTPPYDTASGAPFRKSRNNPPAPESTEFPVTSGTSTYRIFVVPSIPAAVSATVTASVITGPTPVQTPTVKLGATTFANYTPPVTVSTRTEQAH